MTRKLFLLLCPFAVLSTTIGCKSMGFDVGLWDYLTFLFLTLVGIAFVVVLVVVLGLPGRIAIARHHPEADAVNLMGWLGFMAVVPWIQAFIWAFKPTNVVDVRYFPRQEQEHIDEMLVKLSGRPVSDKVPGPSKAGEDAKGTTDTRE